MAAAASDIRVVFCDLDGTLFTPNNEQHVITQETAQAVRRLQREKSVAFVVSTGRPYPDVFPSLATSGIEPDYYITSNGARIHDRNKQVVFGVNMDPAVALDLLQLPCTPNPDGSIDPDGVEAQALRRPRSFTVNINCEDEWLTDRCLPEVRAVFHPDVAYQQVDPGATTRERLSGTHSMWLRGDTESLACVDSYVQHKYAGVVRSKFALPFVLDVFPDCVNKGQAVKRVCEDMLDLSLASAAAFGDGWNDEAMLAVVGHPFVMRNAPQGLKDALPRATVVGSNSNTENGVATKINELFFRSPSV